MPIWANWKRCTSFKEKIRKHPNNVNAGLLTYPTPHGCGHFDSQSH